MQKNEGGVGQTKRKAREIKLGYFLLIPGSILAVILGGIWYLNSKANKAEKKADDVWLSILGPMDDIPRRFPKTRTNQSALHLERLAAAMGIDLTPKSVEHSYPTADQKENSKKIGELVSKYLTARIDQPDHKVLEPEQSMLAYLAKCESQISEMVLYLQDHDPPNWMINIEELGKMPVPNLLGLMQLQKILLVRSLIKNDAGEKEESRRALNASWKLNEKLYGRPDEISLIIAASILSSQAKTLRQVPVENSIWHERLAGTKRLFTDFYYSQQTGVWSLQEGAKRGYIFGEKEWKAGWSMRWAYHRMVYDYSLREAEAIQSVMQMKPCSSRSELSYSEIQGMFPNWNKMSIAFVDPVKFWNRIAKALLQVELTQMVLQMHDDPPKINNDFHSFLCTGEIWRYRISDSQGVITFSKSFDWTKLEELPDKKDCNCEHPHRESESKPYVEPPLTHTDSLR